MGREIVWEWNHRTNGGMNLIQSHRKRIGWVAESECLKMGFFNWFKRSPNENDNTLGELVSIFVFERTSKPNLRDMDLWSEATYAHLFSVAWEVVFRSLGSLKSPEALQSEIGTVITDTANHSQYWINELLGEAANEESGLPRIAFDIGADMLRSRMTSYFNIALDALDERGYDPPVARSHSCWVILTKCAEEAMVQSVADGSVSAKDVAEYVKQAFDKCENLVVEINAVLDQIRKS